MYRSFRVLPTGMLAIGVVSLAIGCSGTIGDAASEGPENGPGSPGPGVGQPATPPVGGGAPAVSDAPTTCGPKEIGVSPMHRLTRHEYDNTIRDLIGESLDIAREFTEDERAGEFSGNFHTPISELQLGQYATAAAAVAERSKALLGKLVPCDPATGNVSCAESFIRQFGRRAHRRPLDDGEVARYRQLYELGSTGAGFPNGIKLVIEAMLQSPHFLYLVEGPGPLTQHQLAARLSYFLWKGPPDNALAGAADAGKLGNLEGFRSEARRLMADPRAQHMIADFHTQWLGLEKMAKLPKDPTLYPGFDSLRVAMAEETTRFVGEVMKEDGKLSTLLTAGFSVVNGPLATLYGKTGGADWKRIELDRTQRAGLLTQGSFLAMHGALDGSSPIRRGLAVRERFLCAEVPPPPPGADQNVPESEPSKTTRQRFDNHRTVASCAACHVLMDPIGYGFETYDGIGRFRTTENGVKVDDSGSFAGTDVDGPFQGARGLADKLATSSQMQACVTTQWFRYAFGRLETRADDCVIKTLSKRFADSGHRVPDLLLAIVESDAFRTHRGEE